MGSTYNNDTNYNNVLTKIHITLHKLPNIISNISQIKQHIKIFFNTLWHTCIDTVFCGRKILEELKEGIAQQKNDPLLMSK